MAVTFDNSSSSSTTTTGPLSWSHTVNTSGSAIVVGCVLSIDNDPGYTFAVALDPAGANTAFTSLGSQIHTNNDTHGMVQLFGLADVASGVHTIRITVSGTGGTITAIAGHAVSEAGALTVSPFSAQQNASGSTGATTLTFTGSASTSRTVCIVAEGTSLTGYTGGGSQTSIQNNVDGGTQAAGSSAMAEQASDGSDVFTWTPLDWYALAAVEVLAGSTGPTPVPVVPFQLWPSAIEKIGGPWPRSQQQVLDTGAAAPDVRAQAGVVSFAESGIATEAKVAPQAGVVSFAESSIATEAKVAPQAGVGAAAATGVGVEGQAVVAGQRTPTETSQQAIPTAALRYSQRTPAFVDFGPPQIQTSATIEAGTVAAGVVATSTAKKVAVQGGACAAGAVGGSTARKIAPQRSTGPAAAVGSAVEKKVAAEAGVATAGVSGSAAEAAGTVAPERGTVAAGATGSAVARKVSVQTGVCSAAVSAGAVAAKRAASRGVAAAAATGTRSGVIARAQTGLCTVAATATSLQRKTSVQRASCGSAAAASGLPRKIGTTRGVATAGVVCIGVAAKRVGTRGTITAAATGTVLLEPPATQGYATAGTADLGLLAKAGSSPLGVTATAGSASTGPTARRGSG